MLMLMLLPLLIPVVDVIREFVGVYRTVCVFFSVIPRSLVCLHITIELMSESNWIFVFTKKRKKNAFVNCSNRHTHTHPNANMCLLHKLLNINICYKRLNKMSLQFVEWTKSIWMVEQSIHRICVYLCACASIFLIWYCCCFFFCWLICLNVKANSWIYWNDIDMLMFIAHELVM